MALVKVGRKRSGTEFWGPKELSETVPGVTNSCQSAVLLSVWLIKSKLVQYFRCIVYITEFPGQVMVDRDQVIGLPTERLQGPSDHTYVGLLGPKFTL